MSLGRHALLALSRSSSVRTVAERNSLGKRLATRFVAGATIQEALDAVCALQRQGISSTLDRLGEDTSSPGQARASADDYHAILDVFGEWKTGSNISVKLSQMGLNLSVSLAEEILSGLVAHAARAGSFVRIDMEDSAYTETTIALTERLHRAHGPDRVGTVIQAYLYRSEDDVRRLLGQGIRIRLCKGAYREGPDVAFPSKGDVDRNYFQLAKIMLSSGTYHGLATHDEALIDRIVKHVERAGVDRDCFEFQMLYGIRRELQRRLVKDGFKVRVYVPFGNEWYPYFMRRLAERPANLIFLAKNLLRS